MLTLPSWSGYRLIIHILDRATGIIAAPSTAPAPVTAAAVAKSEEIAQPDSKAGGKAQVVTPWDVQGEIDAEGKAMEM